MSAIRLCSLSQRTPRYFARHGALFVRSVHRRSTLPYPIEKGLGKFLPPPALKVVAVDYQDGLLERLNDEARGTEYENMTVVDTLLNAATHPTHALTYSYASLALNNHFFLDHLKPLEGYAKNHQDKIDSGLLASIGRHYNSVARLKSAFSAVSLGTDFAGYVWLVTDKSGRLAIVTTSGAESLVVQGRFIKSQERRPTYMDLYTEELPTTDPYYEDWLEEIQTLDPQDVTFDRVMAQVQADESGQLAEAVLEEMNELFPEEARQSFREGKGLESLDPDMLDQLLQVLESEKAAEDGTLLSEDGTLPSGDGTLPSEDGTLPSEDSPISGERHASPSDQNTVSPDSTLPTEEFVPPSDLPTQDNPPTGKPDPPSSSQSPTSQPGGSREFHTSAIQRNSNPSSVSDAPEATELLETGYFFGEDGNVYKHEGDEEYVLVDGVRVVKNEQGEYVVERDDGVNVYKNEQGEYIIEKDEGAIEEDDEYDEDEEYDDEEEDEGNEEAEDEKVERSPEDEQAYREKKDEKEGERLSAQAERLTAKEKETDAASLLDGILYPLFCVPVREHAWLSAGYGVFGQEEWLKQFWTVLDWEKVSTRYRAVTPRLQ